MHYQSIPAGTDVEYQGVVYRVRAAYGRVLELESSDFSFARVVHVSSVKRLPLAHENLGCGLAAPAGVGQGVGTPALGIVTRMGQDASRLGGEAIEPGFCAAEKRQATEPRNKAAWLSVADFLTLENLRAVLASRRAASVGQACAARADAAGASALPDGNHGENK